MSLSNEDIAYMSFFFIDIVGLSDPVRSTMTQVSKIRTLNRLISECSTFAKTKKDQMIVLPTGDGMAIGFRKGFENPMLLAKELHLKLNEYNRSRSDYERLEVRIGCNDGHVFFVPDIYGNLNFWGPGIILARRVMDLGEAGHILMTSSMAEILLGLSDSYRQMIHPIHDYEIKHDQKILLYSVYGEQFGNAVRPKKGVAKQTTAKSKIPGSSQEPIESILYKKIELRYSLLDAESKLIGYRRSCYVENSGNEPIFILNEVLTSVKKSVSDINLRLYDERNNALKLGGVVSDADKTIFIVKFDQPILPGEGNRLYTVAYEAGNTENRVTEMFFVACQEVTVAFEYPLDIAIEPRLSYVYGGDERTIDRDVIVKVSGRYIVRWKKLHAPRKGDAIKLVW
ncbi:MAG: hypothetical protein MN733_06495 [Nitrososphaera sp.]|nr:hypothetical protein [Nitrososphaera sp.]